MTLTSATSTTQAVVNHHLERFAALDLHGRRERTTPRTR